MNPSKLHLERAYSRTSPFRYVSPLIHSSFLSERWKAEVYLKCEQKQVIGAFKIRGAANFALQLDSNTLRKGIATHSSGNHAQAVAYMASLLGIKAYVVMPSNSNKRKIANAEKWGAEITLCEPTFESRISTVNEISESKGVAIVPPFDHEWIVEGQATCAMEILREDKKLDYIIAPLGGGGLLAGTAMACHYFTSHTQVIGTEPAAAADGYEGILSGNRVLSFTPNTVADGLRTTVGEVPFPIIQEHVKQILLADEEQILPWMKRIWEADKMLIEPSSAVPIAALDQAKDQIEGKRLAIIITGGNVDLSVDYSDF